MQLYERLTKIVDTFTGGNITAFCRKTSIRNTTFSNYLNEAGQKNVRLDQLLDILEAYPQLNRDWLFFDEGEMFVPGFRMGMRMGERVAAPEAETVPTPVADTIREAEIGIRKSGASETMVWHVVAHLADQHIGQTRREEPEETPKE